MGINVLLFVVVQVGLEPWRRARLVRGFEEKVKEAVTQIPQQQSQSHQPLPPETLVQQTPIEQLPIQHDTNSIAIQEDGAVGGIENVMVVLGDDGEIQALEKIEETGYVPERKDIWISAAGGAVIGGLITALGTWFISR